MSLEVALLGFLAERPRSGYDLKTRCFTGPISVIWTADQAQIYRTLERLREAGLVTSSRRRQSARPDRHLYELTDAGRDALSARVASPAVLPPLRDPFLVGLMFSAVCDDEVLLRALETRRGEHQAALEALGEHALAVEDAAPSVSQRVTILRQTALEGAMTHHRATLEWLDECIAAIQGGALPASEAVAGERDLFAR